MKLNCIKEVLDERGISQLGLRTSWVKVLISSMHMFAIELNQI